MSGTRHPGREDCLHRGRLPEKSLEIRHPARMNGPQSGIRRGREKEQGLPRCACLRLRDSPFTPCLSSVSVENLCDGRVRGKDHGFISARHGILQGVKTSHKGIKFLPGFIIVGLGEDPHILGLAL